MAITPQVRSYVRSPINSQNKLNSRSETKNEDSDDGSVQGQGIIDNTSEYASMGMLAASHLRRKNSQADNTEEWSRLSEHILDNQADKKIIQIEALLSRQMMTPKQLRAFLLQFFIDPSDMFMALAALIQRNRLKKEYIDRLKKLQVSLQKEDSDRDLMAGVNVALVAKAFAKKMQQLAGDLRTLYREFIHYDGPVIYLYEQWSEELSSEERLNLMVYLERALTCDLQALLHGNFLTYANEFTKFFSRVGRLRELHSLDAVFKERFLQTKFILFNKKIESALSRLFICGVRSPELFKDNLFIFIKEQLNALNSPLIARFLQLLIISFASLPTNVFPSLDIRERLIDELKEYMEDFVKQESIASRGMLLNKENGEANE